MKSKDLEEMEITASGDTVLRIAQTSDNHLGITNPKVYRKMLLELAKEDFDIFVHPGDYCGGVVGHKTLGLSVRIFREIFPDKPYLSVIGNHDFWMQGSKRGCRPSLRDFQENLEKIKQIFQDHNVHFLDEDGIFHFQDWVFIGNSGWYNNPNPPTNDHNFLPHAMEGDTNRYLLKRAHIGIGDHLNQLGDRRDKIIFVSHFPVIPAGNDWKGGFAEFSWSKVLGELIHDDYNCRYFLNGHAHQLHKGPLRYESGSDYSKPAYQIIDVVDEIHPKDQGTTDEAKQSRHEDRE